MTTNHLSSSSLHTNQNWYTTVLTVICLTLLIGCSSSDDGAPIAPAGSGDIKGVVAQDDGQVYSGVGVNLLQAGTFKVRSNTDNNGAYEFANLSEGSYEVTVTPPLAGKVQGSDIKNVTVKAGSTAQTDFTFELVPVEAVLVYDDTDTFGELKNADGDMPVDDAELVYARNVFEEPIGELYPIEAPDGHHLTLGEWRQAKGTATASCDGEITKYSLSFSGLIPNGVYTVWHLLLDKRKESDQSVSIENELVGMGALGGGNGEFNNIIASPTGEGQLTVEVAPGPMSLIGDHPACSITSLPGFFMVLNYHIDDKTHGIRPGPDRDDIAHMHLWWN